MGKIEKLEHQVKELSPKEFATFREWFIAYDWEAWDHQLEQDVLRGRLDAVGEKALRDHAAGKSSKL